MNHVLIWHKLKFCSIISYYIKYVLVTRKAYILVFMPVISCETCPMTLNFGNYLKIN